jgi:hypothetical protein
MSARETTSAAMAEAIADETNAIKRFFMFLLS